MPRHIVDGPKARKGGLRLRQFLNLQRLQHPARASLMLQRRARKGESSARSREFTRIDRGRLA